MTLASWAVSPLALLLAQVRGFANSTDVLTYLFAMATQAPFLFLVNESLAPAAVKGRIGTGTRQVILILVFSSLFGSVWYSLYGIELLGLKPVHSMWIAIAVVIGVLFSFKSSARLLQHIVTAGGATSTAYLALIGTVPGLTLLALFGIYSITYTAFDLPQRAPFCLTAASIVLPNFFHYLLTKNTLRVAHNYSDSAATPIPPKKFSPLAIGLVAMSCLIMPLLAIWGNDLRMTLGKLGPSAWILLSINMLFTAFLIISKTFFLRNLRVASPVRSVWMPAGLVGLAVLGLTISNGSGHEGILQAILALLLVLTCNVAIIATCRNAMSLVNADTTNRRRK